MGDRAWGWAGHVVDILAVLATLFTVWHDLARFRRRTASGKWYSTRIWP
ncbi:BCCT family transporter [Vibrio chagasii]|nr:BCCT family transporter [Vibrio chagasii]